MIKTFSLDLGCSKCVYVKSWNRVTVGNYYSISARLDQSKIRLDRSKLMQILFPQNFPTQPKPI